MNCLKKKKFQYFGKVKTYVRLMVLVSMLTVIMPVTANAVGSEEATAWEKNEPKKEMDNLSLMAYLSAMAGLVSIFFIPVLTAVFFPVAMALGGIAFLSAKKRYAKKRGKGLAIAAFALGGLYTLTFLALLLSFALFGF